MSRAAERTNAVAIGGLRKVVQSVKSAELGTRSKTPVSVFIEFFFLEMSAYTEMA